MDVEGELPHYRRNYLKDSPSVILGHFSLKCFGTITQEDRYVERCFRAETVGLVIKRNLLDDGLSVNGVDFMVFEDGLGSVDQGQKPEDLPFGAGQEANETGRCGEAQGVPRRFEGGKERMDSPGRQKICRTSLLEIGLVNHF